MIRKPIKTGVSIVNKQIVPLQNSNVYNGFFSDFSSRIWWRRARATFRGRATGVSLLFQRHWGPSGVCCRRNTQATGPLADGTRWFNGQGRQRPDARRRQWHPGFFTICRTPIFTKRAFGRIQVRGPQSRGHHRFPDRSSQSW